MVNGVSWPHRMARGGAEPDMAQGLTGVEVSGDGSVPAGQLEAGVIWGRKNRGRRREPA